MLGKILENYSKNRNFLAFWNNFKTNGCVNFFIKKLYNYMRDGADAQTPSVRTPLKINNSLFHVTSFGFLWPRGKTLHCL